MNLTTSTEAFNAYAAGAAFGVMIALAVFNFVYGVQANSKRLIWASMAFAFIAFASVAIHYVLTATQLQVPGENSAISIGAGLLIAASLLATLWSIWKIQLVNRRNSNLRETEFRDALNVQSERRMSVQTKSAELFQINASLEQEIASRAGTEKQLRAALDNENAAFVEHGRFVRMLSHEFRTPLAVIEASTHLLGGLDGSKDGAYQKRLLRMRRSLSKLVELVEDSLGERRLVQEELTPQETEFDLRISIRDACTYLEEQVGRVVLHQQETQLRVLGDPALIAVAINNLVQNAIQYSTAGTDVLVSYGIANGMARVDVENAGSEIPDDEKDRIFQRYFRGGYASRSLSLNESRDFLNSGPGDYPDSQINRDDDNGASGVGLGLYLARKIARKHSGDVLLVSSSGGKNIMRLELPLALNDARRREPSRVE